MTWVVDQSGTSSALTINSETQLGSDATTNATYAVKLNTSNLAAGDILEVRIYSRDISAGTIVQAWKATFSGVQTSALKISPPVPSDQLIRLTVKQTAGTGRTFTYSILRI